MKTDIEIAEIIPGSLREVPQWVCWRYEVRNGKQTKVPVNIRTGSRASSTDGDTWTTFESAWDHHITSKTTEGVGFVFTAKDGFCGVDLDDCIEPGSEEMEPWAREIIEKLDSYTEVSPSGTGLKIFLLGRKPGKRCRKAYGTGEVEVYDSARFFTVTGRRVDTCPAEVESRQPELDTVYGQVFGRTKRAKTELCILSGDSPPEEPLDDDFIIRKASSSRKSGTKFSSLWDGQWGNYFSSPSEADSSLCFTLAFYTKDSGQIDRIFRRSGLMRPKWDEDRGGQTYGQMTIGKALDNVTGQFKRKTVTANADGCRVGTDLVALGERDPKTKRLVISPQKTLPTAEAFVKEFHQHPAGRTLHSWAGLLLAWKDNRYGEIEEETLKNRLLPWLHQALTYAWNNESKEWELVPFSSNPSTVRAALESIRALVHLPVHYTPPRWLAEEDWRPLPKEILPCRTMNLHIPTEKVIAATPSFFTTNALDFDYRPDAPRPDHWLAFLDQLWGDDVESVQLLQEWFGYCLTADTSQQKMLLMVGPRRSGKGTIGRVLTSLVGTANVCGPTISSLAGPFGLQPLIGKSLALVSDARFACKDMATVVERLLCISGEDALTIDRKHKDSTTMRLPTRLMFLTNELPRLSESSGALSGRFLALTLTESFYGREDRGLSDRLQEELPGILLWALGGWKSLNERGRFVQPKAAEEAMREVEDLSSPVGAFVRSCCEVGPGHRVWCDDLYSAWCYWCECEGWQKKSTRASFGRDLAACVAGISRRRGSDDARFYEGIGLKEGR